MKTNAPNNFIAELVRQYGVAVLGTRRAYRGQFRLIRFPRGGANAWLLVKSGDSPE